MLSSAPIRDTGKGVTIKPQHSDFARMQFEKNEAIAKLPISKTTVIPRIQQIKFSTPVIVKEIQGSRESQNLIAKIEKGFGTNFMKIDYIKSQNAKNTDESFEYGSPNFPKIIDFSKLKPDAGSQKSASRYVYVYARSWEQLTMCMRALISLAGQAKIGGRKLVEPFVKNSRFSGMDSWNSLGLYFNMKDMQRILKASGYAAFVEKKEYDAECSAANNSSRAVIHFLYNAAKTVQYTKTHFGLTNEEYNIISKRAKVNGWTECAFIEKKMKKLSGAKQFCVDPSVVTDWTLLERDVVRGAKCLTIYLWRGIGGGYRTYFSENHAKIKTRDVLFALSPSIDIQKEVQRFKKDFLSGRYIAVQVRGERVVISHNLDHLRQCINLLIKVIEALKKSANVSQVIIATDMSKFGSGSWSGSLKGESYDEHTLPDLHNSLVKNTGAVVYKATDNVDNGVVALVEMSLISQAQHLITIGGGSFQEWIVAKFLESHRDDKQRLWSYIQMCSK